MMGFRRGRPGRARSARRRLTTGLETLESRQLLSAFTDNSFFHSSLIATDTRSTHTPLLYLHHPIGTGQRQLSFLDNDGKILTGKDREGDEWQITVHGPGAVIVTDATPNDGALDDDLDTIQIVGSDPERTFVTGQVTASARVLTEGTVRFNRLVAENGVAHIELNGFNLAQTVLPTGGEPNNFGPEVYLPGGVQLLSFNDIEAPIDLTQPSDPIDIVIGRPNEVLRVAPTIRIGKIFNTVYDGSGTVDLTGVAIDVPSVNIQVNGQIHALEMVSATAEPDQIETVNTTIPLTAGVKYEFFPQTGTTGQTAVRALGIGGWKTAGSVRNLTASRGEVPFSSSFSGMNRIGHATFGGTVDGLGLDVSRGPIGRLTLLRGAGDIDGSWPADTGAGVPRSEWGNSAFGLLGAQIVAQQIGKLEAGPSHRVFQSVQDPDFAQQQRTNWTTFYTRPGRALTNTAVMTDGSIGETTIVGDLQGSEIKAGANYQQFAAGLDPVRSPSSIGPLRIKGSLVDSVISASYRPTNGVYGDFDESRGRSDDVAGPGVIRGRLEQGGLFDTQRLLTALGNEGQGFYARRKDGYLPPPLKPSRIHGVNVDF